MSQENLRALADYRLEQADESLLAGIVLLAEGLYRPAVNRAYYAMFCTIMSLLAIKQMVTSKHGDQGIGVRRPGAYYPPDQMRIICRC